MFQTRCKEIKHLLMAMKGFVVKRNIFRDNNMPCIVILGQKLVHKK